MCFPSVGAYRLTKLRKGFAVIFVLGYGLRHLIDVEVNLDICEATVSCTTEAETVSIGLNSCAFRLFFLLHLEARRIELRENLHMSNG